MKIIKQHDYSTNPESIIVKCEKLKDIWVITAKDVYKEKDYSYKTCGYRFSVVLIPEEFGYYSKGNLEFSERLKLKTELYRNIMVQISCDATIIFY